MQEPKILESCVMNNSCSDCANYLCCMEVRSRHILLHECKGTLEIVKGNIEERRSKLHIPVLNSDISSKLRKNTYVLIIGITFFGVVGFQSSSDKLDDEFLKVPKTSVVVETDEFLEVPETSVVIEPTINSKNSIYDLEVETIKKELVFNGSIVTKAEERLVKLEKGTKKTEELEKSEEESEPIAVISAYGPSETYYYHVTDEEKDEIAKVVWREAVGESLEGKVAVAATVLNRFTSGRSDFDCSSIHNIITQRGAFASIENVSVSDLTDECYEAVEMALKGYDPTRVMFPSGAYFFFNPDGDLNEKTRAEREGVAVYVIGNHWFHTDLN